ncbi:MAG: SDR family NAD(P)-dependent oxidoreductase [Trueperaceae bacterium]|nr:SDR family NAD(P)-dependent oxidoreductase [Trueperaceae bacterium]
MAPSADLSGREALVTGASGGIGYQMARGLARAGARVWMASRPGGRGARAAEAIRAEVGREDAAVYVPADLSVLAEVRDLAERVAAEVPCLDVLVNNAGRFVQRRTLTADGFEMTWALNHLAPFLTTHLLMRSLRAAEAPRVITTSSNAERSGGALDLDRAANGVPYSAWRAYGWSKQANVHFARELARRTEGTGLRSYAFHPGFVRSGFARDGGATGWVVALAQRLFGRSAERGAETGLWLAALEPAPEPNGGFFVDHAARTPSPAGRDAEMAAELWARSEAWVGLRPEERLPAPDRR